LAEESLVLFRELEDRRGTAWALMAVGSCIRGDRERRAALMEEGLSLSRAAGYRWLSGVILYNLGGEYLAASKPERAGVRYEEGLAIGRELRDRYLCALTLAGLSHVAQSMGDELRAIALLEESVAASRSVGDRHFTFGVLIALGHHLLARGEYERASGSFEEALVLSRETGNKGNLAQALQGLASVVQAQGDHKKGRALLEEALALYADVEDIMAQGHLFLELGDHAAARSLYEEGLVLRRERGDAGIASALLEVGHAAWLQGEPVVTRSHALEALELLQALEDKEGVLAALESLGVAALAEGHKERAARLTGAVEAWREALRLPGPTWWRRPRERIGEAARVASLQREFAAAWGEGHALSLDQATIYARMEKDAP
jgi:tetratricopeptide (TPR) repeat protein